MSATTTNYWAEFVAANKRETPAPSEADLAYVAEYNARGDREKYGAHFADVDGLAAEVEVQDEEQMLADWLSEQTWSDFAQSLAAGFKKYGGFTQKQLVAARSMKAKTEAREQTKPEQTDDVAELAEWLATQTWSDFAQSLASFYKDRGYLSEKQLTSARSMKAKVDARQPKQQREAVDEDGIYLKDGVIYKVQIAKQGSGNLYAKKLMVEAYETDEGDTKYIGEWEYVGRKPLYELTADDKLTYEEAAKFGSLYGICGVCGAELTDEASIERGIGPICAQKWD